jgi:acyl-CoA thioester hydrolase
MNIELPYLIHRSAVNKWECDENGHLNVRYFFAKTHQGLTHLLAELGLTKAVLNSSNAKAKIANQHVRLHREILQGVPVTIRGGLISHDDAKLVLYSEIRHTQDDTLFTTVTTSLHIVDVDTGALRGLEIGAAVNAIDVPEVGMIRSLQPESEPDTSVAMAATLGYLETARGTVMAEECDQTEEMENYQYAGHIADAIPNFMSTIQSVEELALRSAGELGGAVIEIRVDYYAPLAPGKRFVILSGLRSFTVKTMRMSHLFFDLDTDRLVLHSQGIAVALDLKARRAVPFTDDRIARMTTRQLRLSPA